MTPPDPSPIQEYNLWDEKRMHVMNMRRPFQCGPFELEPFRVTHSIPDCCGLVLRSEAGTVVHTGDWKIDENPVDGEVFDREFFEQLGEPLPGAWVPARERVRCWGEALPACVRVHVGVFGASLWGSCAG